MTTATLLRWGARYFLLLISLPLATAISAGPLDAAERVLIEWRFDQAGEFRGWQTGGAIGEASVRDGALQGQSTGSDPILFSPVFDLPASPTQRVEVRMRASEGGRAELFWTETLEGPYGGFSQEKSASFSVAAGESRAYRVSPYWHPLKKIIRLRFDPPSTGSFAIASVRIVDEAAPVSEASAWDFRQLPQAWSARQQLAPPGSDGEGLQTKTLGPEPLLFSPLLNISAQAHNYLAIRMAVSAGQRGRVYCVNDRQAGRGGADFPLHADGRWHTYNIDLATLDHWDGQILLLQLQPSDETGAQIRIGEIVLSADPVGPPDLQLGYFGGTAGVQRPQRPFEVVALLRNLGGQAAEEVTASLTGDGAEIVGGPDVRIEHLSLHLPKTARWQVRAQRAGPLHLNLAVRATGASPLRAAATLEISPSVTAESTGYPPPPQPVSAAVDVGVFYFPGWHSWSRWQPILGFPERKPALGWYDEANPECADWQIKWAVEHGVRFFMVDWYWDRGNRHLEHWLHQAYAQARYRSHLKWAVMWANHNPPRSHSPDDWRAVTQYWIDNYFSKDEYYRIDGRPAVFIWAPANIRSDVGGSDPATELYALSQQMAREAGLPGIYFVAMSAHESPQSCERLHAEGYEAFTSYHAFELAANNSGSQNFPFSRVVETAGEVWRRADQRAGQLDYIPIVDTGWSSEPWHGHRARVISGRTPELFGQLCRQAADYARQHGKPIIAVGPWNEWGEGSYIEPYAEHGFADLDQLRTAFCPPGQWPPNLVPADVGCGPYDLKPLPQTSVWNFDRSGDAEGWTPNSAVAIDVVDGQLRGQTNGDDPLLQGPAVSFEASRHRWLVVRMSCSRDDTAQLFWATATTPQSEENSVRFATVGDRQLRDHRVDLGAIRRWRGVITGLRFDPGSASGTQFAIDCLRLEP